MRFGVRLLLYRSVLGYYLYLMADICWHCSSHCRYVIWLLLLRSWRQLWFFLHSIIHPTGQMTGWDLQQNLLISKSQIHYRLVNQCNHCTHSWFFISLVNLRTFSTGGTSLSHWKKTLILLKHFPLNTVTLNLWLKLQYLGRRLKPETRHLWIVYIEIWWKHSLSIIFWAGALLQRWNPPPSEETQSHLLYTYRFSPC